MLLGEFNHSIDEKGRLIIPAKLRDDLGDSFVICNGLEGCLFVYSQEEWNKFVAELETLPRMNKDARIFKRYFFGSASEGSFDKQVPVFPRQNGYREACMPMYISGHMPGAPSGRPEAQRRLLHQTEDSPRNL